MLLLQIDKSFTYDLDNGTITDDITISSLTPNVIYDLKMNVWLQKGKKLTLL